ncbi:hypothetical protein CQJ30_02345 [Caldibacillus thermoamylovorans]|jgi:hypothetical protein|nr:hypothetical protein CQJ30_02345 [Caldibacillus thermoamylovorans]PAC30208.1 hypothetical protein CEJ87_18220 [Caldifermentibacillus hisashii]
MGVGSNQPLAKSKGVHREVESEGSWRQNSGLRNTNIIRRISWGETAKQVKARKLPGHGSVNGAGIWKESESSYRGRSHGRVETVYEARLK